MMKDDPNIRRNNSGKTITLMKVREIDEYGDFYCPRCYSLLDGVNQKSCRYCRQKLDWRDWRSATELPYEEAARRCLAYAESHKKKH